LSIATGGWWLIMGLLWRVRPWISSRGEFASDLAQQGYADFAVRLTSPAKVSLLTWESNLHAVGLTLVLLLVPTLWWTARNPARFAFTLSGASVWLVLSWDPFNDPFMMWVTRRFVPVVIPWVVVGTIYGLACLHDRLASSSIPKTRWIPVGILALLLILPAEKVWFQARIRDWPGATAWFAHTAELIPEDAVLLTDQPGFGSPFRFIWGKSAFELRRQRPELLRRFLDLHAHQSFAENLWILTTSDMLRMEPGWEAVHEVPMKSSIQSTHKYKFPRSQKARGGDFVLYRWVGSGS
jgi:hypothetical protein